MSAGRTGSSFSPPRVLLMRIGRHFRNYTGHGNEVYQTLRFVSASVEPW